MMTIDKIIELVKYCKELCVSHKNEPNYRQGLFLNGNEYEQLIKWLEDYKKLKQETEQDIYERAYMDGRTKGFSDGEFVGYTSAIDDLTNNLLSYFNGFAHEVYNHVSARNFICDNIEVIAEQLKGE